jgi:uncharacterized protein (TIGR02246 family)
MMRNHMLAGLATLAVSFGVGVGGAVAGEAPAPPPQKYDAQYARDRAEIEDLQARYLFALDWQDADAYAATFAPDGVLDWAGGIVRGREAIRAEVRNMRASFAKREATDAPARPARLRHLVSNVVIRVDGDRATSVAEWFEINNDSRTRWPMVQGYGHFEDEFRRVDGRWLIASHKIYNEAMDSRAAGARNPAPPP